MLDRCNRCRIGFPEFSKTLFTKKDGKVYHEYVCVYCGNKEYKEVNPFGYDINDPRVKSLVRV